MNSYLIGNQARLSALFTGLLQGVEVPNNPPMVTFKVRIDDGPVVDYTWPGSPEVANPQVGEFVLTLDLDEPGTYRCRVEGTGSAHAVSDDTFVVHDTAVK